MLTYIEDDTQNDNQQSIIANTDSGSAPSQKWAIITATIVAAEVLQ